MSDDFKLQREPIVSVAHLAQQGDRSTMEDFAGWFEVGDRYKVTYVCDGHGGEAVARHLSEGALEAAITLALGGDDGPKGIKERMKEAFVSLDDEIRDMGAHKRGSTVCMAIVDTEDCTLHVVNCGDSRCMVLANAEPAPEAASLAFVAPLLTTRDHSGSDLAERHRIMDAGGIVIQCRGVYRVMGSLAVTRALGDQYLKEYVISEPDVYTVPLGTHLFSGDNRTRVWCILATDGLWHYVSNEAVISAVRRNLETSGGYEALPNTLMSLVEGSHRLMDNTTIMVIQII